MDRLRIALALAALAGLLALVTGAQAESGVKAAKPAYLEPAAPGVVVDPILSTGDIVGDYQMSGVPDGLGAYADNGLGTNGHSDDNRGGSTFTLVMNHELVHTAPPGVDSRISRLVIDGKTRSVVDAEYLFTGQELFERFCSSTLAFINGRPLYFTGEESTVTGHDGSSVALDPETGKVTAVGCEVWPLIGMCDDCVRVYGITQPARTGASTLRRSDRSRNRSLPFSEVSAFGSWHSTCPARRSMLVDVRIATHASWSSPDRVEKRPFIK